jgi:hypothetical protein
MVGLTTALPARGEEAAAPGSGWSFALTPYVWFAGLEGDVATLPGLPPVSVDAGFDDIIENADLALMLLAEARRGRFGVLVDLTYLGVSTDGDTPGPLFGGAEAEVDTFLASVFGAYRAFERENVTADLLAGVRVWSVNTEINLSAGLLPARSTEEDEVWADPVIGARARVELGRGFVLTGFADVGGFGAASDLTWQALGAVGYAFSDRILAHAGYRHLEVDYDNDGFVFDVAMSGPILGVNFRF